MAAEETEPCSAPPECPSSGQDEADLPHSLNRTDLYGKSTRSRILSRVLLSAASCASFRALKAGAPETYSISLFRTRCASMHSLSALTGTHTDCGYAVLMRSMLA